MFKTLIAPQDNMAACLEDCSDKYIVEFIHAVPTDYGPYADKCLSVTVKLTPKPLSTKFRRNLRGK